MKNKNLTVSFMTSALMIVLFAAAAWSQVGTSIVTGTITDPQGRAVAGATVKLIGAQGGAGRSAVSNDSGVYTFPSTAPGLYKVEVEMTGFKKATVSNFKASVDSSSTINVVLELGQVTETVMVDAGGLESIVNVGDASLGNTFVSKQIEQLPLQGRNVANLLSLQAGVTPDGSVTGGRSDQANITLDGIDVNNQQNASAFSPVLRVNPDSVDEFRVTTSNPDASKGRSSGAQISLITKSGSNKFSGALYEYHRNTATSANDWFNNAAGSLTATDPDVVAGRAKVGDPAIPRPKLIRNLFGGRLGGPIVKDRFFFFYNYEGMREAKGTSVSRTVPLASLGSGQIQFVDNTGQSWTIGTAAINTFTINNVAMVDVNPLVPTLFAQVAARYKANDNTLGDGRNSGGFRFNAPTPVEQNAHTARFDWNVTRDMKHVISLRGNYQQDITGAAPYFPDTPATNTWSHPLGYSVSHTWLVNSNLTNRLSYGQTRIAFSNQGDSNDPAISFRYIFQPSGFVRTFNRTNPTTNITDDLTWINGSHTWQFGTNIRTIKNTRVDFAKAFDNGQTNPSAYASNAARTAINQYITAQTGSARSVASAWDVPTQGALVALIGRLSGYGANFNFKTDGTLVGANTGIKREFKTEEYDFYLQDSWKFRPNVTFNLGLRYGLSVPVYETQGYETAPSIPLSTYLENARIAMNIGGNYREPLSVRLAGKVNGKDSIYPMDKDNWQPRLSVAWSPEFKNGFLGKLFGKESESVFRAGFAITNDYFGQQLATNWDGSNTLGFSSSSSINVNTYNLTTNPAPLYSGPSMSIRTLPNIITPATLSFPQTAPFRNPGAGKIETSLDQNLVSPINYSFNFSYGRKLPGNIWMDAAYVGRLARHLLAGRDVMMLRDIRDPISGVSYNEAGTILDRQLQANVAASAVASIPFYDNMWAPGTLRNYFGCPAGTPATCTNTQAVYGLQPNAGDWTYTMQLLDQASGSRYFFQGQYDSLSAFGTVGTSDYHGATLSFRQRLSSGVTWDFNYTFAKSLDDSSGLQTGGLFGTTFILNAFKLRDQRAPSDFDLKHVANFNGIWDLPIGKGRKFGSGMNPVLNALVGGWQMSTIVRYDSGYPVVDGWYDSTGWQTNWNIRSYNTQLRPVSTGTYYGAKTTACTTGCTLPNLFADPNAAYAAFRTPHPGETGTRNGIRYPGSFNIDAGLAKSFDMPYREGHKLTFRWDVFNVTNTPFFDGQAATTIGYTGSAATASFGRYTDMRNSPRIMQFALRYDF